ncbi:MAG: helix-turn-helix domain-containing protein [bacterium]|nr:helix-turn-helix domain-containing protein [bacterium]
MKILDDNSKDVPIRRPDKRGRFYLDNEIIERDYLKILDKTLLVYMVLAKRANAKNQGCFLTYETIMKEAGITNRNTMSNSLKVLVAFNMIIIKHVRGTLCNFYYLIDNTKWKPANSIKIDTIISVSKYAKKPYQKEENNSVKNDTLNQRRNSTYKIGINNKLNDEKALNVEIIRTPEEQERINRNLAKIRKELGKKLGWKQ